MAVLLSGSMFEGNGCGRGGMQQRSDLRGAAVKGARRPERHFICTLSCFEIVAVGNFSQLLGAL